MLGPMMCRCHRSAREFVQTDMKLLVLGGTALVSNFTRTTASGFAQPRCLLIVVHADARTNPGILAKEIRCAVQSRSE